MNQMAGRVKVKPFFDDGQITIYHGDCRDILPTLEPVDLVLTDPPYGIGKYTKGGKFTGGALGHRNKKAFAQRADPVIGDDHPFDPAFLLMYGTQQIIWGWNHYPDKLPRGSCLVWLKRHDPAFGSFLSDAELAWFSAGAGVYCIRDLSNNSITRQRVHPTQKPVSLMRWCIEKANGQIILDPFMGSGTTLRAAKDLGRKAIGIEIEERYCEIAVQRLAQEVLPL